MQFEETPITISYLDLYGFVGSNGWIKKSTIQKVVDYHKDELFALPILEDEIINKALWEMGVNTYKGVEEHRAFHRPNCLAVSSRKEDTPKIFGLVYTGFERTDKAWKEFKRSQQL